MSQPQTIDTTIDLTPVVEAMARARYETYDSHFSMAGGLSWEEYCREDPQTAQNLYRADAMDDLFRVAGSIVEAFQKAGWGPVDADTVHEVSEVQIQVIHRGQQP